MLPLDPIPTDVAGCVWIPKVLDSCTVNNFKERWTRVLCDSIFTSEIKGWCGWNGLGLGTANDTEEKYVAHLQTLLGSIMDKLSGVTLTTRFIVSYFEVAKAEAELARCIINCKLLNAFMGDTPPLMFPTIKDLFLIMSFFADPHFGTADFRHWFYQLKLL